MTPESEVLKACMDYLPYIGHSVWFRRNVVAGSRHGHFVRSGPNGHLDIWGIWHGVHCEIECKKPGWVFGKEKDPKKRKREEDQTEWADEVRQLGGIAFFVTSLDELLAGLNLVKSERGWP